MKTYYEIFGIKNNATSEEIKEAFKRLALQFHPDKNSNGTEKFREIRTIYDVLSDDKQREKYDSSLPKVNKSFARDGSTNTRSDHQPNHHTQTPKQARIQRILQLTVSAPGKSKESLCSEIEKISDAAKLNLFNQLLTQANSFHSDDSSSTSKIMCMTQLANFIQALPIDFIVVDHKDVALKAINIVLEVQDIIKARKLKSDLLSLKTNIKRPFNELCHMIKLPA